jgi:hypothetical protein
MTDAPDTKVVSSAYRATPHGEYELIGQFTPIRVPIWSRDFTVARRGLLPNFIAGPPPFLTGPPRAITETIPTHTFKIVVMRDGDRARFEALQVATGDPVDWLRGWTWSDPHTAARWRVA